MPERIARRCRAASPCVTVIAAVIASILVLAACSDGDGDLLTAPSTQPVTTPAVTDPTTAPASTTSAPKATVPDTTAAPNTFPPTSSTPEPPAPVTLSGDTIELASPFMTNPFVLDRVGTYDDLVVYDGESVDGDFALRCVAIGHDGAANWSEWCALPTDSSTFVVVDGADPWVAEVGVEHGDVVLTRQPTDWVATTSGCVDPVVTLVDAADVAPAVATGLACAGGEAFLTYSSVFMQPGPVDGGGTLLTSGDEGWNSEGGGTSIPCDGFLDGIDRCQQFGVEHELFEAASPFPSPEMVPSQTDFVGVRDVTGEARIILAGVDETADIDTITDAVVAALTPADSEAEPTVVRHDGVSFNRFSLLMVDVPLADDSVRSTTWVAWITTATPEEPSSVHRAYAWDNCGRGLASSTTCV